MSARACGVPLLLLFTLLALAASYPSEDQDWRRNRFRNPSEEDELVIVPLGGVRPRGVDDRAVEEFGGSNEDSSMSSLAGFFQGMQAMIWQLRNQMAEVLRRIPQESFEGSNGFEMGPWSGLPGNTTSTTKVINGHVVTVNETTYSNNNNGSSAIFHIKVVDIKPQDSGEQAEFIGSNEEVGVLKDSEGPATESDDKNLVSV